MILSVIPSEEGIQESWMPDRVRHDKARTRADCSKSRCRCRERVGSRYAIFNFSLIPTKLFRNELNHEFSRNHRENFPLFGALIASLTLRPRANSSSRGHEDISSCDQPHDLIGAGVNLRELCIPHHAFNRVVLHVSVSAHDLN